MPVKVTRNAGHKSINQLPVKVTPNAGSKNINLMPGIDQYGKGG